MQTDTDDMKYDMPSHFEVLEVRRALHKGRVADPDVDKAWERFRQTLEADRQSSEESETVRPARSAMLRWVVGIAAGLLLLLGLTAFLKPHDRGHVQVFTADNASQQLTITADDGTPQVTTEKALAFNRPVRRTEHIRMMQVSNPRGKVSRVVLPDGSVVWLNADSHLSFPERFYGASREVSLSGEAYFEVRHDQRHPFIVTTESMTTTVHGTVFDVCAYSSKDARVTLLEGSVAVRNTSGDEQFIRPGQMAKVAADGNLSCQEVDTYPISQWKEGFFYFADTRMIDIMRELGRWYNVNVVFESEQFMNVRLHFVAGHNESLATILGRINELTSARISLKDDVVTVK